MSCSGCLKKGRFGYQWQAALALVGQIYNTSVESTIFAGTHTQNRLRKAIFVCVVLAESLACFLQFTRDSPQTVTEYNISYTFRHCCLIPPLMISSSPKKSLKLYHWCCSMPEPDADAWRILKSKKLHSTDSSFLVNWCMNSFNR